MEALPPGLSRPNLPVYQVELSSLASVRALATDLARRWERLDLLVNNAGLYTPRPEATAEGFDLALGVNFLSHFLLSAALLPLLEAAPRARLISLGSVAHKGASLDLEDEDWARPAPRGRGYAGSKLACLLFSDELDRRLRRAGFSTRALCAHPGASYTDVFRALPAAPRTLLSWTLGALSNPVEAAARPVLMAAVDPNMKGGAYLGPTGLFELRGAPGRARRARRAQDPQLGARLWARAVAATGAEWPAALG